MNNRITFYGSQTLGRTLAFLFVIAALSQAAIGMAGGRDDDDQKTPDLVGSWELKVSTPFFAYDTLATPGSGGTLVWAGGFAGGDPLTVFSTGHGAWKHTRACTYAFTFRCFLTGANGLIFKEKASGKLTVDPRTHTVSGTMHVDAFAPDGTPLPSFSYDATVSGTQIQVETVN